MRLVSVNVSDVRVVEWRGKAVETGIFKEPVSGRVTIRGVNLDGDRQADRSVHGGEFKAVYAYGAEHYGWWEKELDRSLAWGMFGENLTVEALNEATICIGDVFRVGAAALEAVQPRLPCYKLGIRFEDPRMVKRFLRSGRLGVYFRIVEEGEVGAGDSVTCVHRDEARFPVTSLATLLDPKTRDPGMVERALALPALPPGWSEWLLERQETTG